METEQESDYAFLSEYVDALKKLPKTKIIQSIVDEDETEKKPVD